MSDGLSSFLEGLPRIPVFSPGFLSLRKGRGIPYFRSVSPSKACRSQVCPRGTQQNSSIHQLTYQHLSPEPLNRTVGKVTTQLFRLFQSSALCEDGEEMATHSSILAWEIPWAEKVGGLQSMGPQRVGHSRACKFMFVDRDQSGSFSRCPIRR